MATRKETSTGLTWRTMVRLHPDVAAELERMAAQDGIPAATLCRMFIRQGVERRKREELRDG